jgi:hypothetical protein
MAKGTEGRQGIQQNDSRKKDVLWNDIQHFNDVQQNNIQLNNIMHKNTQRDKAQHFE